MTQALHYFLILCFIIILYDLQVLLTPNVLACPEQVWSPPMK